MENDNKPNVSGTSEEIRQQIIKDIDRVAEKGFLYEKKIGISVSNNEELGRLGYSEIHLRDLTIEIVRQLLISGAIIVYGGDLRKEGYTELFSELSRQYRSKNESRKTHFINYFAFPIYTQITRQHELKFIENRVQIERVAPDDDLKLKSSEYILPNTPENKYIWSKSLTYMRNKMIAATYARIIVGGKTRNYFGKLPGIVEEALIAVQNKKPLYLVGAMGGAAAQVIDALKGRPFTFSNDGYHTSAEYKEFKSFYNSKESDVIDLNSVAGFFADTGVKSISASNGLTVEENERLFRTPHLSEIIYLIFKGLSRIKM